MDRITFFFAIDTNFLISHLQLVDELNSKQPPSCAILLPWAVVDELDQLKNRDSKDGSQARQATQWCYMKTIGDFSGVRVQSRGEFVEPQLRGDDSILDCCRYFQTQGIRVALLSNDRILLVKALAHDTLTIQHSPGLSSDMIIAKIIPFTNADLDMEMMDVGIDGDTNAALIVDIEDTLVLEWPQLFPNIYGNKDDYEHFRPRQEFRSLSDLLNFMESKTFTYFDKLRDIDFVSLKKEAWLRHARTGLGAGPVSNKQVLEWIGSLDFVWAVLEFGKSNTRVETIASWKTRVNNLTFE